MSFAPIPKYNPSYSYKDGKYLVMVGGCVNTLTETPSTGAFKLDLSVSWPTTNPVYLQLPNSPEVNGVPLAITEDETIVLIVNSTVYTLSPKSQVWTSIFSDTNIGNNRTASKDTLGLMGVTNPKTSEILIPGGYLPNSIAIINIANKTVAPIPMPPTIIPTLYAMDWSANLNGFVMLDTAGGLYIYNSNNKQLSIQKTVGAIVSPRNTACMVAAGSEIILFGGYSTALGKSLNDLYILNPNTMTWRTGANTTIENSRSQAACAYSNGYLIVWGGINVGEQRNVLTDTTPLLYNIKTNTWVADYIAPQVPQSSAAPTSSSSSSSQTSGGASVPSNTSSPQNGGSSNTGLIAGVVGGIVVIFAIASLVFFRMRRRRSNPGSQRVDSNSEFEINPMEKNYMDKSPKPTVETDIGLKNHKPAIETEMEFKGQEPVSNQFSRNRSPHTVESIYYKNEYSQGAPRFPEENLARSQRSASGSTAVSYPSSSSVSYPRPPQYGNFSLGNDSFSMKAQPRQPQQLPQRQQHDGSEQYHEFQRYQPQNPQQLQQSLDNNYHNYHNNYLDNTYCN